MTGLFTAKMGVAYTHTHEPGNKARFTLAPYTTPKSCESGQFYVFKNHRESPAAKKFAVLFWSYNNYY